MNKIIRRFTLVEMLTVVGIIAILAGLVIPVVIISQEKGRETQAKSDIAALISAFKQMDTDYGKVLKKASSSKYEIGNADIDGSYLLNSKGLKSDGSTESKSNSLAIIGADNETVYNAMIAELSAPKNKKFTSSSPVSVNKRKKSYLEPKKGFNPTVDYDEDANKPFLWRDPWGNPYIILIKVTKDNELKINDNKTIVGNFAVYSCGPNAKDDGGCNSDNPICGSESCDHDDIASWAI